MYLRNQSFKDCAFKKQYKKSKIWKLHWYINDTVKFDVRKESRKRYSLMNFVVYQTLWNLRTYDAKSSTLNVIVKIWIL